MTNILVNKYAEWIIGDMEKNPYVLNDNNTNTCIIIKDTKADKIVWYSFFRKDFFIRAFSIKFVEKIKENTIVCLNFTSQKGKIVYKEINLLQQKMGDGFISYVFDELIFATNFTITFQNLPERNICELRLLGKITNFEEASYISVSSVAYTAYSMWNNKEKYRANSKFGTDFIWNPDYPCLLADLLVNYGNKKLTNFSPKITFTFSKSLSELFKITHVYLISSSEQSSLEISSYYKQHYGLRSQTTIILPIILDFNVTAFPYFTEKRVCKSDIAVKSGNNFISCLDGFVGNDAVLSSLTPDTPSISVCEVAFWGKTMIYEPSFLLKIDENFQANKLINLDGPSKLSGITIIPSKGLINI